MKKTATSLRARKKAHAVPRGARPASARRTPIDYLNALVYGSGKDDKAKNRWIRYFEPVPELSRGLPAPILGIMVLIWQLRDKDLQKRYSLRTKESRLGFIAWCIVHGRSEYQSLRQADKLWAALNQPTDLFGPASKEHDPANALSWLMVLIVGQRPDLKIDVTTRRGREKLLAWYVLHGRQELGFDNAPLEDWQVRYLLSPSATPGLNRLQELVYRSRSDVRKAFPLPSSIREYLTWFRNFITAETRLIDMLRSKATVHQSGIELNDRSALPFGVNIIGYAFGQLGIGEDARMAAKSFLTTDVPITMLDFPPGDDIPQEDLSMIDHVGNEPKYSVNVFCLTALEHGRCLAERGVQEIQGRYNIGYWPWELPKWPEDWKHLLSLVDEIWVSSEYTQNALTPVSPVPVRLMPMAVEAPEVSSRTREKFSLPKKARLFLFAFDLNSTAKRKNPKACVTAFLKAFPRKGKSSFDSDRVGLVIKVHPPKAPNKDWEELKALQEMDSRIHLIEQTLPKPDLLALYKACDCFVSLHRAEGFGRSIAEAMLLGRPVITTGYSGNLAFTNDDNALLVKSRPIALEKGDYPFGEGQVWADPDVTNAAKQMRRIIQEPSITSYLGRRGKATIKNVHNIESVGMRYERALRGTSQF